MRREESDDSRERNGRRICFEYFGFLLACRDERGDEERRGDQKDARGKQEEEMGTVTEFRRPKSHEDMRRSLKNERRKEGGDERKALRKGGHIPMDGKRRRGKTTRKEIRRVMKKKGGEIKSKLKGGRKGVEKKEDWKV